MSIALTVDRRPRAVSVITVLLSVGVATSVVAMMVMAVSSAVVVMMVMMIVASVVTAGRWLRLRRR